MTRAMVRYLVVSFGWTWGLWVSGAVILRRTGAGVSTDRTLVDLFVLGPGPTFLGQLLFALAVYGPLIGYLSFSGGRWMPLLRRGRRGGLALAVVVPVVMVVPGLALSLLAAGGTVAGGAAALGPVAVYFVSNLVTSGTEEFGWRAFLYPRLREGGRSFWRASLVGGIIWAVWHYPLHVILFWGRPVVTAVSIAGSTAALIAMSYISNLVVERAGAVGPTMLLHALNNTGAFLVVLLFPGSPFGFLTALVSWGLVWFLDRRYRPDAAVRSAGRDEAA